MRVYTVHIRRGADYRDRDAVLVKEGFCWPACFFNVFWALWHRMWLATALFLVATIVVSGVSQALALDPLTDAALNVAVALFIGAFANDLRRRSLARSDHDFAGIVAATGEDSATRRWFDLNPPQGAAWR